MESGGLSYRWRIDQRDREIREIGENRENLMYLFAIFANFAYFAISLSIICYRDHMVVSGPASLRPRKGL
jgi:hypothetical protein